MDSKSVIPLESNPAIFSELAFKLGLCPVLEFHDVYSLTDPDLLAFLPNPIYGVILLFPLTKGYEDYRVSEDSKYSATYNKNIVHWFKQTIRNGCGLYALLHILSNLPSDLIISNLTLSNLKSRIVEGGESLSENEVAKLVEELESQIKLDENFGQKGQTEAPPPDVQIELHFITFVKGKDGHLYELDGRRKGPVDLGKSTDDVHILNDENLTKKIQFYIDNADDANKHNFAIMAIGPSLE
jgi:ubiquitin carboxyl-terminal hydrolase L3